MNILIVEDMSEMRTALKDRFERYGFFVLEAENGEDGLKILETKQIIFVLSDIQMPKMNGIEFLKKARQQYPALPIFIMTGYSPYTEQEVLALGASGYYEKPLIDFAGIAKKFLVRSA